MANLNDLKTLIKAVFNYADGGIYDCRNITGDPMKTIYVEGDVRIDICFEYAYLEIFGLTDSEFTELQNYYSELQNEKFKGVYI